MVMSKDFFLFNLVHLHYLIKKWRDVIKFQVIVTSNKKFKHFENQSYNCINVVRRRLKKIIDNFKNTLFKNRKFLTSPGHLILRKKLFKPM